MQPAPPRDRDLVLRRAVAADEASILELAGRTLGWGSDPRWAALYRWKHDEGAFGPSLRWVAVEGATVLGFRAFLRWELIDPDGRVRRVVRAVDTATHPDRQGQGIFTRLTAAALADLPDEGVELVFNTPNDKSRPGYLKMGWEVLGRAPVMALPTGPAALVRVARARTAAELWSEPSTAGRPAPSALADPRVDSLLTRLDPPHGSSTHLTATYLRWRHGLAPLHYRAASLGSDPADGLALFRVRRRGPATEATITEILVPAGSDAGRRRRRLVRRVARSSGADHVLVASSRSLLATPAVPIGRWGPTVTWRPVVDGDEQPLARWSLSMGDLELF